MAFQDRGYNSTASHNGNGRIEGSHSNSNSATSSGSSEDSSSASPPSTPPSPEQLPDVEILPPIEHAPHSSHPPKRSWRARAPPSARLGAIDEDSNQVSPDIPVRNPRRNLVNWNAAHSKLFSFGLYSGSHPREKDPPPNIWNDVLGPKGEKFDDMRKNRRNQVKISQGRRRRFLCIGLIVLLLLIGLAVGLGVGLTRRKANKQQNTSDSGSTSPSTDNGSFPSGQWAITTYLTSEATSCTPVSTTWRCYPYQTYNESVTGSLNSLVWSIASNPSLYTSSTGNDNTNVNKNNSYTISATQPAFSYPFNNVTLQYSDNAGTSGNEPAYRFQTWFRKQVVPSAAITSDNGAARCYYNNTLLIVTLYASKPKASALSSADTSVNEGGTGQQWPYALEYHEQTSEAPECFRYVDGADGERIELSATNSGGSGQCGCDYMNYGVS